MEREMEPKKKSPKLWNSFTMFTCVIGMVNVLCLCLFLSIGTSYIKQDLQEQLPTIVERFSKGLISPSVDRRKRAASDVASHCTQGPPGRDGRDGIRGETGPPGLTGPRGPPGQQSGAAVPAPGSGGSVYVRWGRSACPGYTTLLYDGVAGGSHFTHTGSGANYICLPKNPDWASTTAGHQTAASVYGTEYETSTYTKGNMFSKANAGGKSLHDHDVPCAVCHAESRNSHVMIPAKLNCPSGWNKEYSGFLMSSYKGHHRAEYVCVDRSPEPDQSGQENKNGALLYFVEAYCGSLPCPKYVEGHELTCVVCTK